MEQLKKLDKEVTPFPGKQIHKLATHKSTLNSCYTNLEYGCSEKKKKTGRLKKKAKKEKHSLWYVRLKDSFKR